MTSTTLGTLHALCSTPKAFVPWVHKASVDILCRYSLLNLAMFLGMKRVIAQRYAQSLVDEMWRGLSENKRSSFALPSNFSYVLVLLWALVPITNPAFWQGVWMPLQEPPKRKTKTVLPAFQAAWSLRLRELRKSRISTLTVSFAMSGNNGLTAQMLLEKVRSRVEEILNRKRMEKIVEDLFWSVSEIEDMDWAEVKNRPEGQPGTWLVVESSNKGLHMQVQVPEKQGHSSSKIQVPNACGMEQEHLWEQNTDPLTREYRRETVFKEGRVQLLKTEWAGFEKVVHVRLEYGDFDVLHKLEEELINGPEEKDGASLHCTALGVMEASSEQRSERSTERSSAPSAQSRLTLKHARTQFLKIGEHETPADDIAGNSSSSNCCLTVHHFTLLHCLVQEKPSSHIGMPSGH